MLALRDFLVQHWTDLIAPLIVLLTTLALGYFIKRVLIRSLRGWHELRRSHMASAVLEALNRTFMVWVLILGLHLANEISELPPKVSTSVGKLLLVLGVFSITSMLARLAGDLVRRYGTKDDAALPVTTLTQTLAQIAVVILGIVVLLNQLGISVTPILTALGVGGLAVALALQDTLSNLFAGFYVAMAGQVRVGDYIRLNTGEEGYVVDISWRSTTLRALANNYILVPNSKLGQANVTNFHLPEKRMGVQVTLTLEPGVDIDRVEGLLLEEARAAVGQVEGLLGDPEPSVRFAPGFTEAGLGFSVNLQVREFTDQYLVQHEIRKRIYKRLLREGFEIPSRQSITIEAPRTLGAG